MGKRADDDDNKINVTLIHRQTCCLINSDIKRIANEIGAVKLTKTRH